MAELILKQEEADYLIKLEKKRINDNKILFPMQGETKNIDLISEEGKEKFVLDISKSQIVLKKCKYQTRVRKAIPLIRLDLSAAPHRNPDGEEIKGSHLHIYKEGFGLKYAISIPVDIFQDTTDLFKTLKDFMLYSNIVKPPLFEKGLF